MGRTLTLPKIHIPNRAKTILKIVATIFSIIFINWYLLYLCIVASQYLLFAVMGFDLYLIYRTSVLDPFRKFRPKSKKLKITYFIDNYDLAEKRLLYMY